MHQVGRYVLHDEIASGGMASVHLGRIVGDEGFTRTVAIKRLHPHVAASPGALEMFIDEARLSARVRHRNIVTTLDVVRGEGELFLVMEYVHGVSLAVLERTLKEKGERIPLAVVSAIVLDVLAGLAAVHATVDELGRPLAIVHRDVSPQNILVGVDGSARVLDFGIAKAAVRVHTTKDDRLKGKLHYMAPEQFLDKDVDGRTDQFAVGVVLWGMLTNARLFEATNEAAVVAKVLEGTIVPPSRLAPSVSPALDALVERALRRRPSDRFATCDELASALRAAVPPATMGEVAAWVAVQAGDVLEARNGTIARMEAGLTTAAPKSTRHRSALADQATATAPLAEPARAATAFEGSPGTSTPRRRLIVASAGASALVLLTALAVSAYDHRADREVDPRASAPMQTGVPSAVASGASTLVTTAAAASSPSPEVNASSEAHASATPAPTPVRPARAPKPARTGRPSCAQMYTTDANGIQRVKSECL